jgi:hypothetical protein
MCVSTLLDVLYEQWRIVLWKTLYTLSVPPLGCSHHSILTLSYAPFST